MWNLKLKLSAYSAAEVVLVVLVAILWLALSFFGTAGILWLINWAFHCSWWSWRTSFGIWLLLSLISGILKNNGGNS